MNAAMLPMGAFGAFGPKKMAQYGLFGAPMAGMVQQKKPEEEKPNSWFDGGKFGAKDALALALGAIGDGLTRRPMTSQMILGNMMNKRQTEQQEKSRQQQRMEGREDKMWEWQNAPQKPHEPDSFERALIGAGIDPNGPEGRSLFKERAASMAGGEDEFVVVPIPGLGTYAGPKSGLAEAMGGGGQPPQRPVGKLTPIGGGVSNGTGGF